MRLFYYLALIVALAPREAAAQSAADGADAILRGDYESAVRFLRPLAAEVPDPDPLAQFLLATLYESGQGVPRDSTAACGLYGEVARSSSPLMLAAQTLARDLHGDHQLMMSACARAYADIRADRPVVPPPAPAPVSPNAGDALPTTADGLRAFARGEHQQAADILQRIVDTWPPGDRTAEFFLATLYESGRGIPLDLVRACALYIRASFDPAIAFGRQAMGALRSPMGQLSAEGFRSCNLLAILGFDHRFVPVMFSLGPAHWVSLDVEGAKVGYNGFEKWVELGLNMAGSVFLPVEHTALTVGRPPSERRHFVEIFVWVPAPTRQSWTLSWRIYEVVRDEFVTIGGEDLTTVSAPRPPEPFDVREWVRLRVNEHGHAEWVVLGSEPRGAAIPTDDENRERDGQAKARREADQTVDWTSARVAHRPPELVYSDADGCGNAFVFGWSADRTEAIAVHADAARLQLSTTPQTFDLAAGRAGLELMVHLFEQPMRSWPFCTDMRDRTREPAATWRAIGGTVTIELSTPGIRAANPLLRRATIRIVGAELVGPGGTRVMQGSPIILTGVVGWFAG